MARDEQQPDGTRAHLIETGGRSIDDVWLEGFRFVFKREPTDLDWARWRRTKAEGPDADDRGEPQPPRPRAHLIETAGRTTEELVAEAFRFFHGRDMNDDELAEARDEAANPTAWEDDEEPELIDPFADLTTDVARQMARDELLSEEEHIEMARAANQAALDVVEMGFDIVDDDEEDGPDGRSRAGS